MSALSDLLNGGNVTARQAADKAEALCVKLPYGTIAAYWSGRHGKPSATTLSRLAQVVPFTEKQLQEAAWNVTAPLGPYRPPEESLLLDQRQRRAVDELIRSIVTKQGANDGVEDATKPHAQGETSEDQKRERGPRVDYAFPSSAIDIVGLLADSGDGLPWHLTIGELVGEEDSFSHVVNTQVSATTERDAISLVRGALIAGGFDVDKEGGYNNRLDLVARRGDETVVIEFGDWTRKATLERGTYRRLADLARALPPELRAFDDAELESSDGEGLSQSDFDLAGGDRRTRGPSEGVRRRRAQDEAAEGEQ
ncbi:hypothetical protein [Gordonia sp. CPCC 205333]|uniref:hypothetical protein n=1 Tax=Gordonia sp. CPCC 205333 TaxID=3140790 RepID=UPI003AF34910